MCMCDFCAVRHGCSNIICFNLNLRVVKIVSLGKLKCSGHVVQNSAV